MPAAFTSASISWKPFYLFAVTYIMNLGYANKKDKLIKDKIIKAKPFWTE